MIKIKYYRQQRGLTQEQLADKIGVFREEVSMWETGAREPKIANIIKLSEALHVSIEELVKDDFRAE